MLALLLSTPASGQAADSAASALWSVDFVKTREGQLDNYLRFAQSFWKPAREQAARNGSISSYQMLVLPGNPEWDVLLITVYPDSAAHAARESAFRPILDRLRVENPARYQGPGPRELAEVVFTRVFRVPANVPAPSGR